VVKLRPATQNAYDAALKHLRREFGTWRMTDITPTDVAKFVTKQQAGQGIDRPLKGWTIRAHLAVLSAVFQYAARHMGFVGTNPVSLLDRVERPDTEDETPKRILTDDELKRLLGAFSDEHRLIFETLAETGARLSEGLGIVWGDVDPEAETIRITHQLGRDGKRRPLKTKRSPARSRSRRCLSPSCAPTSSRAPVAARMTSSSCRAQARRSNRATSAGASWPGRSRLPAWRPWSATARLSRRRQPRTTCGTRTPRGSSRTAGTSRRSAAVSGTRASRQR
jgi:integrase